MIVLIFFKKADTWIAMFFFSFFFQHIIFMKDKGRSLFCHWLMTYFGRYLQLSFLKLPRHFLLFKENFNWRIISLQHFVGFSCATTSISHKYTYIPSLQSLPSHVHPAPLLLLLLFFCPSRSSQSTRLNDPQSCYWTYTLREPELKKTHYPVIHCNTVYNSQDMEAT